MISPAVVYDQDKAIAPKGSGVGDFPVKRRHHLRARACADRNALVGAARRLALLPVKPHDTAAHRHGEARIGLRKRPERGRRRQARDLARSEEHTSELQSLMRISYAVFCLT